MNPDLIELMAKIRGYKKEAEQNGISVTPEAIDAAVKEMSGGKYTIDDVRGNFLERGIQAVAHGATLGGDEHIMQFLGNRPGVREAMRLRRELMRSEHPIASTVAEIGGSLLLPVGAPGALAKAATSVPRAAALAAGTGAVVGGAYGANEAESLAEAPKAALHGAEYGAAAGGVLGGTVAGLGRMFSPATRAAAREAQMVKRSGGIEKLQEKFAEHKAAGRGDDVMLADLTPATRGQMDFAANASQKVRDDFSDKFYPRREGAPERLLEDTRAVLGRQGKPNPNAPEKLKRLEQSRVAWANGPRGFGGLRAQGKSLPVDDVRRFFEAPEVKQAWAQAQKAGKIRAAGKGKNDATSKMLEKWLANNTSDPKTAANILNKFDNRNNPSDLPSTLYHGTNADFSEFRSGHASGWGDGVYLTDNPKAAEEFGDKIVKANVTLRNPYKGKPIPVETMEASKAWKDVSHKWESVEDAWQEDSGFVGKLLRELGYDGVATKNSNSIDGLEVVVFDPKNVKKLPDHAGGSKMGMTQGENFHFDDLQQFERLLDGKVGEAYKKGNVPLAQSLKEVRGAARKALETLPEYKKVNAQYAARKRLEEALASGDQWWSKVDKGDFQMAVRGLSGRELHEFRTGLASGLVSKLRNAGTNRNEAQTLLNASSATKEKLAVLFGSQDKAAQFLKRAALEGDMARTGKALGGSETKLRLTEAAEGVGEAALHAAHGPIGIAHALGRTVGKKVLGTKTAEQIGPRLLTQGKDLEALLEAWKLGGPKVVTHGMIPMGGVAGLLAEKLGNN